MLPRLTGCGWNGVAGLLLIALAGCTTFEFDNPLDPRGIFRIDQNGNADSIPPVVRLAGADPLVVPLNGVYRDPGATATDETDGDLTGTIIVSGSVNPAEADTYVVTYTAFDKAGNSGSARRSVIVRFVEDTIGPVITVNGRNPMDLYRGDTYYELSATAVDEISGDVSASVVVTGSVNTDSVATYTIQYTARDAKGNTSAATRTVVVRERPAGAVDTVKPQITLKGGSPLAVALGATYTEPGATATDNTDGDITKRIVISGTVNTGREGTYQVLYSVADSAGNQATATRIVVVGTIQPGGDTIAPLITLKGENPMRLTVGQSYPEPGATASDNKDGDLSGSIVISGTVNASVVGTYTITYTVEDVAGNRTVRTRTVTVAPVVTADTVKPVITLKGPASVQLTVGATWSDSGATARDEVDGDLTSAIVVTGTVNTAVAGTCTLTYSVSDKSGNRASVARTVTVAAGDPSDLLSKYGVPGAAPLSTIQGQFAKVTVEGTGPSMSTITRFDIDWQSGQYGGLHGFALQTSDGKPDWYVDLKGKVTQTFGLARPGFTLTGSGFTGLDGQYYVAYASGAFVWVRIDGSFAIIFAQ